MEFIRVESGNCEQIEKVYSILAPPRACRTASVLLRLRFKCGSQGGGTRHLKRRLREDNSHSGRNIQFSSEGGL